MDINNDKYMLNVKGAHSLSALVTIFAFLNLII